MLIHRWIIRPSKAIWDHWNTSPSFFFSDVQHVSMSVQCKLYISFVQGSFINIFLFLQFFPPLFPTNFPCVLWPGQLPLSLAGVGCADHSNIFALISPLFFVDRGLWEAAEPPLLGWLIWVVYSWVVVLVRRHHQWVLLFPSNPRYGSWFALISRFFTVCTDFSMSLFAWG